MEQSFTISPADRRIAAAGLAQVLAATGVLWMKTQGFAWNAVGRESVGLKPLLDAQAQQLMLALGPLSLRIRALGFFAPTSLADLLALSPVAEQEGVPVAVEMARQLARDHAAVTALIRCIRPALDDIEDNASCLVLDHRLCAHEGAVARLAAIHRECPARGMVAASVREALVLAEPADDGNDGNSGAVP